MKGSEARMPVFMEGADKRFVIPVYQRKYNRKTDNCLHLYEERQHREGYSVFIFM